MISGTNGLETVPSITYIFWTCEDNSFIFVPCAYFIKYFTLVTNRSNILHLLQRKWK
jgi:hypothetical protein